MGIVKDAELRKGKAELVRALATKGVVAQPYERLDVLAAKVAGAGGGGENRTRVQKLSTTASTCVSNSS